MGGIVSRFRQSSDDYEKILSDLDSNIRKAELRLSAINLRERRVMSHWLIYSVLIWLGYTAAFALYLNREYYREPQIWALVLAPVVMGLPAVLVGRSLISEWYKRAKTNEESQLSLLRADQRLKVEELKKRTAYYSTRTLLERYDPQSLRAGGPKSPGADGRPDSGRQNGQPNPQQPNMMDPGLRQRQGPGGMNAQGIPAGPGHSKGAQPPVGQGLPNGPHGPHNPPFHPNQPHPSGARPHPYGPPPTNERHWYDKIVDVIVGDEGPDTKYALVCGQCYTHNGLVLPQEIEDIQYVCPKCNHFNPSRRRTRMAAAGNLPPATPEQTLLQAQNKPLPASRDPSPSPPAHRLPLPDHHHHQHHQHHHHHHDHQDGFGLQESNNLAPLPEQPSFGEQGGRSEGDEVEFVNNWDDSEAAEGAYDDEENTDSDSVEGFKVDSGETSEPAEALGADGPKKRAAGKRKTKRT
ncbi:hypothetical protein B0O80DRAFT_470264 [Mortierella sp. GBAus27b]|nr:hypothetical protein B0O80DRAFT_470264 [Mortierella sp. GBAus27b]